MELKKIEAEATSHPWGPKEKSSNPRSPKLPYFDEHTDKMDSYLTRFESYALSNKWDPSMWASYLSALLKGRALEVFVRLSRDDQSDYGQIKEALLTNFDLTERSFRKKFRDCRPEKAETFRQFSGRLASYLDKWLGLAKVEKTYEAVCDFLARDQFLDCCSHELYLYLKPKPFKAIDELAHKADLFADHKGGVPLCISKGQHKSRGVDQAQPKVEPKQDQRPVVKCKICGKPHPLLNVGITLIIRKLFPVRNLIPSIGEIIHIGVKIGILVAVTSVTIIMTTITGPTIRSIFVKLIIKV